MCSYNLVNGTHVSDSKELLTDVLRTEWGWRGLVLSDWTGVYSVSKSIKAGLDVEMPGPPIMRGLTVRVPPSLLPTLPDLLSPQVNRALQCGKLTVADIDERIRNVCQISSILLIITTNTSSVGRSWNSSTTPSSRRFHSTRERCAQALDEVGSTSLIKPQTFADAN